MNLLQMQNDASSRGTSYNRIFSPRGRVAEKGYICRVPAPGKGVILVVGFRKGVSILSVAVPALKVPKEVEGILT